MRMSDNHNTIPTMASSGLPRRRRLVLIGGGHTHCQVVQELDAAAVAAIDKETDHVTNLVLISDAPTAYYSGMIPGAVAGLYSESETQLALAPLAAAAGWTFVQATVTGMSAARKTITLRRPGAPRDEEMPYDLLSIDIGSATLTPFAVEPAGERCVATRPISLLNARIEAALDRCRAAHISRPRIAVVGGGAAGVELCLCLEARFRAELGESPQLAMIHAQAQVLDTSSHAAARAAVRELRRREVALHLGQHARRLNADGTEVELEDGTRVPFDLLVLSTGPAAHPWPAAQSDLPVDDRGFIRVKDTLQTSASDSIFACGDCCSMDSHDGQFPPKAGVYAVRSGPVLTNNIRSLLRNKPEALKPFVPQKGFLSLLTLGDGRAIGTKYGLGFTGGWVWRLKDHIDTTWMRRFAAGQLPEDPKHRHKHTASAAKAPPSSHKHMVTLVLVAVVAICALPLYAWS